MWDKKFHVPVVFPAPNRRGKLYAKVNKRSKQQSQCKNRHMNKFIPYEEGAAYGIPHSCGVASAKLVDVSASCYGSFPRHKKPPRRHMWQSMCMVAGVPWNSGAQKSSVSIPIFSQKRLEKLEKS